MKKLLALAFLLFASPAWAQNPQCPTRPSSDSSNACASTAFVHNAAGGNIPGVIIVTSPPYNAACNETTDDTAAIAAAIAAVPVGGKLIFPGTAKCLVRGSGSAIFTLTSPIAIEGQGFNPSGSGGGLLIASDVPTNRDIFHVIGVTNSTLRGWHFSDFNITSQSVSSVGQHLFHFDTTAGTTTGFAEINIDRLFMDGRVSAGGYSIFLDNGIGTNTNGGTFNFTQRDNYIGGGLNCQKCGDSIRSYNNIIASDNPGFVIDQVSGAGGFMSIGDNNTSGGGCYIIKTTVNFVLLPHICERSSTTNANGALIDIQGPVDGGTISGGIQSVAPGTAITSLVRIANSSGITVSNSRLGSATSVIGIQITNTSTGTCVSAFIDYVLAGGSTNFSDSGLTSGCVWQQLQSFKLGIFVENSTLFIDSAHVLGWGSPFISLASYIYGQASFGGVGGSAFRLVNNAGNVALNFGGDTASFPSWSQVGTTFSAKLADASAYAPIEALTVRSPARTFASLVACVSGTEGTMAAVTDSTTSTWGNTITGGSTNHVLAYCNGTNWTVAAK